MKKSFYALVALVVIAVLAALVGPSFIDWQDYKADIARELETATGRRVAIDGAISLRLLPAPSLRAKDVRIANVKGGAEAELAKVGTLQMDLALWPLLGGRIVGTGVVLIKPQISLEILADGKPNWLLGGPPQSAGQPQLVDDLTLRGGTIRYRNHALGQDVTVEGSEIAISGGEIGAPHLVRGTVQLGQTKLTARGSFTRRSGGLYAVLIDIGHLDSDSRLRYSGVASLGDRGPRLSGKVTLEGTRPHQFLRALAPDSPLAKNGAGWLKDKLAVTADLTVVGTEASIGGVKVQLGEIEASGQIDASLTAKPRYRVALTFNRLDLDAVMTRMAGGEGKSAPRIRLTRLDGASALALEVTVNALIFRSEIIRDLHVKGGLAKGKIQLHSLTAQLPGAAELQLVGSAVDPAKGHFEGGFHLNAGNLRGTLDWLGLDTSRVPASRLRRASASGSLSITADGIALRDTNLDVDTSRMKGTFAVRFAKRPRLSADVSVDRIDVSAYMPRERPPPAAVPATPPARPGTTGKPPDPPKETRKQPESFDWRNKLDADFNIRVERLTYAGRTANAAQANGTFEGGVLRLSKAAVRDLGGVSGEIKGTIAERDRQPKVDITFDGSTSALSNALGLFGLSANAALDRLGEVRAKGAITGGRSGAELKATIAIAGGQARLEGDLVPSLSKAKYDLSIALEHPRAEEILVALAVSGLPANAELGPVSVSGKVSGDLAKASFPALKIAIGKVALTAAGAIEIARVRPLITGEIKTGALTIEQLLAAPAALIASSSGAGDAMRWTNGPPKEPLFLDGLKALDATLVVRPAALAIGRHKIAEPLVELELRDGVLDVKRATGRIFGGDLSLRANLRSEKATLVDAALTLRAADLTEAGKLFPEAAFTAGKLNLDADLKARGISIHGLIAGLNGTVAIKMRDGAVAGFDLDGINQRIATQADAIGLINLLTEGMSTGTTKFERLDGVVKFVNGVGQVDDLALTAKGGSATGKGTVALVDGRLDGTAEFRFDAIKTAPPLTVALSGKLDDLKAVFRFNALQRHLMARRGERR